MACHIRLAWLFCLCATPLFAHHGRDFLLAESYELPHPGVLYAVSAEQFLFDRASLTFRDEPSLLWAAAEGLAVELHAHVEKERDSRARLEAVAPAIHLRLFDAGPLHTAVSGEYEFGRHGAGNASAVRFIAGDSVGEGAVVGNIGVTHDSDGTRAVYALAYRPDMEARQTWGIEAKGAVHRGEQHEAIVAAYRQSSDKLTIKAGIGAALGHGRPLVLVRTGVVWRF
ncbi:MAG: hypothetical protein NVSMB68_13180 [Thermoanaerobaculia bacterium]